MNSRQLGAEELLAHFEVLRRTARALCVSTEDTEDLVQETCVRVLARERVVEEHRHAAYLATAVRNTHRERRRKERRRPVAVQLESTEGEPFSARDDVEALLELRALIDELPSGQRDAVLAVDVLGLHYAEAAASLNVPTGTIMSRLCRGRRVLAQELAESA